MATTPKQLPAQKPRNFVAKNALGGGAGAHKDKKKALKQGDVKHKNKSFDMAETLTTELRDYDKIAKAIATKSAEDPRPTLAKAAKASMVKRHAEEKAAEKKARDTAKSKGDARVQEATLGELSKDTIKSYVPKRIEKTQGELKTDYEKSKRIVKKDLPRAMSKLKDPSYGKATSVAESLEPLRKKKIKESYTDFLHNVLEEIISKKK